LRLQPTTKNDCQTKQIVDAIKLCPESNGFTAWLRERPPQLRFAPSFSIFGSRNVLGKTFRHAENTPQKSAPERLQTLEF
jgi:hypothetical protein